LVAEITVAVVQFKFQKILKVSDVVNEVWKIVIATGAMAIIIEIGLQFSRSYYFIVPLEILAVVVYSSVLYYLKYSVIDIYINKLRKN